MDKKTRVLIFGDYGNVGFLLRKTLSLMPVFEVVNNEFDKGGIDKTWESAIIERHGGEFPSDLVHPDEIDILRIDLKEFIERYRPDIIVNCAAVTSKERCENWAASAFAVNAVGVYHIVKAIRGMKTKLIHLSSTELMYNIVDIYGASKLAGEKIIDCYLDTDRQIILRLDEHHIDLEKVVSTIVEVLKSDKDVWGLVFEIKQFNYFNLKR